ncbi:YbhB/YbcL family Raf kinase inhibitor-like protein [Legionella sp. km772]|uniref:YbhB/YbcL family Raf kinase inhibitor-like protein n=1 Tax=Legionella sp. km772 TaxID=2498111 RepID=UPI000F8F3808|nr:YbhB/YbcL family Raf kinase inhibitor-like protein [Legionella sp. km772]RUR12461.1 YbhB/YbcL family Raf kinase inhibitor-like protein [Legionella sp. km772]
MKKYSLFFLCLCCSFKGFTAGFSLASPAFSANGMIPPAFTCQGADKSPPLVWSDIPAKTVSLALVVEDPDAPSGPWTHWLVFNIPPSVTKLEINSLPEGALLALNSWGNAKYQGPCPPLGAHRYVFTLYALDKMLSLSNGAATRTALDDMTGHVIGSAILSGLYQKE